MNHHPRQPFMGWSDARPGELVRRTHPDCDKLPLPREQQGVGVVLSIAPLEKDMCYREWFVLWLGDNPKVEIETRSHRLEVISARNYDSELTYFCDDQRHLICSPFSIENLHKMAEELNLKRCWFHASSKFPHYDIPKTRVQEITSRCYVISAKTLLRMIKAAS
jgi:hypothetical protein